MSLSNRDRNLIEAFRRSCQYETVAETVRYLRGDDVYAIHKYAFLIRPATDADKAAMKQGELYPVLQEKPLKMVKDITRCDPAVCLTGDGVSIPDIRRMKDAEFLPVKAGTGGSQVPFLYFLKDRGAYKEATEAYSLEGSSLSMLPMRPYSFKEETLEGNYDGCTFALHVFLPLNAPIVVIAGDVVRLYCMTMTDFKDILYKPVLVNNHYYQLDGWRVSKTPGSSTYQYLKKLKGIKQMKLPSPIKHDKPAAAAPVTPPADTVPLEQAAEEQIEVPPLRPVPRPKAVAKPAAPKPAPAPVKEEPQVEEFQEPVDVLTERECREIIKAENEACAPVEEEPMGETTKDGYTAPPASQINTEPGPDAPAEKKRTRKAAPVVPVGFDFGPVIEYTGSALPEDLTADQIEAEARSLRDLGINISRRLANLIFAMHKTTNASELKLKQLAELLGK